MHLLLALSVIILQHVNSYSCRSILRTLDDLNSMTIEDSSESFELRNEEIMELLRPFLELKPEEEPKKQQVQKNLAKLTIEPYLENNRTRKGQRNPFNSLNKRKTLAPLAIILTNLPDLKLEQAGDKIKKEKSLREKVNENSLYVDSEDVSDTIQYHLMKANKQNQISDEMKDIDIDEVEYMSPQIGNFKKKPNRNILDDDETQKPVTSKTIEVTTRSPDTVSDEGKDLNNSDNYKKYEETIDVETRLKAMTEQLANKVISNERTKPIEGVENSKDDYASDDYTLYPTDLENKDLSDSSEYQLQKVLANVSEAHDSLAENNQLVRELSPEDVGYAGETEEEKLKDEEKYQLITSNLKITQANPEFADQTLEIENLDRIIQEPNKLIIKDDVITNHQKDLYIAQNELVLEEEQLSKEHSVEAFSHQKPLHISEDRIILESSEGLSKEYAKENSQSHPHLNIVLEEDDDLSNDYTEENPLMSPQKHQHNLQEYLLAVTDEELSNEDAKEKFIHDYQNHLHSLHEMHESNENWHNDMDDRHSSYTHKIYNLYFHLKR